MGYILPITQYTYINYQARMLEGEKSPYYIDATYKVTLNKIQGDGHDQSKQNQYEVDESEEIDKMKGDEVLESEHQDAPFIRRNSYIIDKATKAILTGKGNWMNQQV